MLTTKFIEQFKALKNVVADINIEHILYGNQTIKNCVLHPVLDGERIGFTINEEDIYITMDELISASVSDNVFIISSEVMDLYIKLS